MSGAAAKSSLNLLFSSSAQLIVQTGSSSIIRGLAVSSLHTDAISAHCQDAVNMAAAKETETAPAHKLASRLDGFDGPTVWHEFTPLAKEHGAVNLGQGFPDWESPAFLKEAGKRAIDEDHNQYTRSAGHPALVQELSKWYSRVLQRDVDAMTEVRCQLPGRSQPAVLAPTCCAGHCDSGCNGGYIRLNASPGGAW